MRYLLCFCVLLWLLYKYIRFLIWIFGFGLNLDKGVLLVLLCVWFLMWFECCCLMSCLFFIGSCILLNWFFWVNIFCVERLWFCMWELSVVMERVNSNGVMKFGIGFWWRIFFCSFWMVFFVIGFLFLFLMWLILIIMWCFLSRGLLIRDWNFGVGFVWMIVFGLFRGWSLMYRWRRLFWREFFFLLLIMMVDVYEVMYLCRIKMNCFFCCIIFVVNEMFMVIWGFDVVCFVVVCVVLCKVV